MRYNRQVILSEIGQKGQDAISRARVLVIGAGGLGCPVLLYLAGAGVGTIGIVDHDRIDLSNLHRQVLFSTGDQGIAKANIAGKRLQSLNPDIILHVYEEELTDRNAISLFSGYDIIVDGTDNFSTKFLINDVAVKLGKAVVYGAIQKFEGQVSVFDARKGPCYRCLHPQPPREDIMNCAEGGVIGAIAGVIGSIQAMEVIKIIVNHPSLKPLTGKLWMIDSGTMETNMITIPKRTDCPVCSHPAEEIIPQYTSPVCSATMVAEIDCAIFFSGGDFSVIDVREREEWDNGHIPEAMNLPLSALQANPNIFVPPGKRNCLLYCQRGVRSRKAAEILQRAGFTNIFSLKGGYEAWEAERT